MNDRASALPRLRVLPLLALAILVGCATPTSAPIGAEPAQALAAPEAAYSIRIRVEPQEETAHVVATLTGRRTRAVDLSFAERYAFVTLPPSLVGGGISCVDDAGETQTLTSTNGFRFTGRTSTSGKVTLTWRVRLDGRRAPEVIAQTDHYEHSYVEDGHGMLFTAGLVPMPNVDVERCEVTFDGPFKDSVRAPWPHARGAGAEPVFEPSQRALADDIVLVGEDWTAVDVDAGGMTATFAVSPGNERLLPLVHDLLAPIVEEEVRLFGAPPRERYLFVFGPSADQPGLGGSPKSGAITMYASETLSKQQVRGGIAHLVAHEFHHTFGRGSFVPKDEIRFFIEGFTDYYAYLVPWRLGVLNDASFHRVLERKLSDGAAALSAYERSLADAGGPEFFAGRHAYRACYSAGLALALWTDVGLRRASAPATLDGVMRELHTAWAVPLPSGGPREVGLSDILKILQGHLLKSQLDAFTRAVTSADEVSWEALFDSVSLPVDVIRRPDQPAELRVPPSVLSLIRSAH